MGTGFVTNLADSQGMQNNRINPFLTAFIQGNIQQLTLTEFGGFGETPGGNELQHPVPTLDVHMEFATGPFKCHT